jgi:hypothetical protein
LPSEIIAATMLASSCLLGHVVDERAVDLQRVDRQPAQVAERRIPGAEVIERDPHAELAHLAQLVAALVDRLHQHRFGDLEIEAAIFRSPADRVADFHQVFAAAQAARPRR